MNTLLLYLIIYIIVYRDCILLTIEIYFFNILFYSEERKKNFWQTQFSRR